MNMISSFSVFVSYTQILVQLAGHPAPGLLWTDDHVAQGFAWSEGVVSFGVPDHDGECLIEVRQDHAATVDPDAIWAIQVPFLVSEPLLIGTVFDMRPVTVAEGRYNLVFEALPGRDDFAFVLRLTFVKTAAVQFEILKKGGELSTSIVLRKDADLAG